MLVEGMGCDRTEENMHLGFKLLSLAAEQNEPHALLTLRQAHLMQGDAAGVSSLHLNTAFFLTMWQALEMLKRAVSVKHPEAMYIYGHMYASALEMTTSLMCCDVNGCSALCRAVGWFPNHSS
jgi:TPR repeat protein